MSTTFFSNSSQGISHTPPPHCYSPPPPPHQQSEPRDLQNLWSWSTTIRWRPIIHHNQIIPTMVNTGPQLKEQLYDPLIMEKEAIHLVPHLIHLVPHGSPAHQQLPHQPLQIIHLSLDPLILLCMAGPLKARLVHEKRGGLQLCNGMGSARKTWLTKRRLEDDKREARRWPEKWLGAERKLRNHTETSEKDARCQEKKAKTHDNEGGWGNSRDNEWDWGQRLIEELGGTWEMARGD